MQKFIADLLSAISLMKEIRDCKKMSRFEIEARLALLNDDLTKAFALRESHIEKKVEGKLVGESLAASMERGRKAELAVRNARQAIDRFVAVVLLSGKVAKVQHSLRNAI